VTWRLWLRRLGDLLMTAGERCYEASGNPDDALKRVRYLEQRHTEFVVQRRRNGLIEVARCGKVVRIRP
jgi:hypothetical protein